MADEQARLERELKTVELELAKIVAFIKRGVVSDTLQQELMKTEAAREDLRLALAKLVQAEAFRASAKELEAKLATVLGDWTNLRTKPIPQQRQLLRKLVPDRIVVTPYVKGARKWIDWTGSLLVAPIISGITPALGDVLPDDPMGGRWWPQRELTARPVSSRSTSRGLGSPRRRQAPTGTLCGMTRSDAPRRRAPWYLACHSAASSCEAAFRQPWLHSRF